MKYTTDIFFDISIVSFNECCQYIKKNIYLFIYVILLIHIYVFIISYIGLKNVLFYNVIVKNKKVCFWQGIFISRYCLCQIKYSVKCGGAILSCVSTFSFNSLVLLFESYWQHCVLMRTNQS